MINTRIQFIQDYIEGRQLLRLFTEGIGKRMKMFTLNKSIDRVCICLYNESYSVNIYRA